MGTLNHRRKQDPCQGFTRFITRGGIVPDRMPASIHLIDESLNELSAPMAVPEPKAALLGGLGLLVLLMRRR